MNYDIEVMRFIFTAITAGLAGVFGSWVHIRRIKAELKKEYASRLNERKWEVYTKYAMWTSDRISHLNEKDAYKEFSRISADLALVASDKVLKAHDELFRRIINSC